MIDLVASDPPEATPLELPLGRLVTDHEHLRVTLVLDAGARLRTRAVFDRLDREATDWFCLPRTIEETPDSLVLAYALDASSLAFSAAVPRWRTALAVHLPELIAMARYLERCAEALAKVADTVAIAPGWLRWFPTGPARGGRFRLLAVPLVGIGLADWASASPETWSWLSNDVLLGRPAPHAGAHAVGAALYTAIAGELFPVRPVSERFRRALRGQAGAPGAFARAALVAVPSSFTDEAGALAALVTGLLSPEPPAGWRDQLAQLGEQLGAHRTAVRWEYEGKIRIARQILERFAVTVPRHEVPWEVLARLRDRDGDGQGALAAALEALGDGDPDAARGLLRQLRRVAREVDGREPGGDPGTAAWIASAIAALDQLGDQLGDLGRIHLAHIEARYLGRASAAGGRLVRRAAGTWDEILRCTLLARLHAGAADWTYVAKLCEDTRLAIRAMPLAGGTLGAYTTAYLDYLDGVAHFGAVGMYSDSGYLADAFERFVAALGRALEICAADDELVVAVIDWLDWVGSVAHHLQLPAARAIGRGINAYLAALGSQRGTGRRGVPPLIWFDEDRLLALSEAS